MESGQVQLCLPERPSIPAFSPYRRQCVATPLETTQWLQSAAHLLLGGCSSAHCWDLHHGSCNLRFTWSKLNSQLTFMVVFWRDYDISVVWLTQKSIPPTANPLDNPLRWRLGLMNVLFWRVREKERIYFGHNTMAISQFVRYQQYIKTSSNIIISIITIIISITIII